MNTENMSYQAGQAKAETKEKASSMADKASSAAQSAKESMEEAGAQMQAKARDTMDSMKDATGMNK
ncbi:hypothetical protein BVRB_2g025880 [Beta vulgaris subsp. vulgaris]|uniref:stress-induced protein KIN2 n=1 Tax=Beta vulgaris subsp. vulgaris TaxID=3555 RepID=UPI00053F90DD|nr:stress-induced protein KIN2 [Beta vulgaris subsp. vulgaris]KMT18443.1 hypothetical protein BVRB_2g025880 [Beta vulgaris subsp. vulgaris]